MAFFCLCVHSSETRSGTFLDRVGAWKCSGLFCFNFKSNFQRIKWNRIGCLPTPQTAWIPSEPGTWMVLATNQKFQATDRTGNQRTPPSLEGALRLWFTPELWRDPDLASLTCLSFTCWESWTTWERGRQNTGSLQPWGRTVFLSDPQTTFVSSTQSYRKSDLRSSSLPVT